MTIEKSYGGYYIYELLPDGTADGLLVKMFYMDYTKKEAIVKFRQLLAEAKQLQKTALSSCGIQRRLNMNI